MCFIIEDRDAAEWPDTRFSRKSLQMAVFVYLIDIFSQFIYLESVELVSLRACFGQRTARRTPPPNRLKAARSDEPRSLRTYARKEKAWLANRPEY